MYCRKCKNSLNKEVNYCSLCGTPVSNSLAADYIEMIAVNGDGFSMKIDTLSRSYKTMNVVLSDYYIGKYPVTQKQWEKVMKSNPSLHIGSNLPVDKITWFEALTFCNRLSMQEQLIPAYYLKGDRSVYLGNCNPFENEVYCSWEGNGYRLPTEAEWEFAARGGETSKGYIFSGSNKLDEVGWYYENSGDKNLIEIECSTENIHRYNCRTHPVGQKRSNELGIYDMSGNVSEWCWDVNGYYPLKSYLPINDPHGPEAATENFRLFRKYRGGCFFSWKGNCMIESSESLHSTSTFYGLGFRVVRSYS